MTEIEEIKRQVVKQALELEPGGFRPTNSLTESWIGRVYLYKENERIPLDKNGEQMIPLLQLCIDNLPLIPKALSKTKVITVFIASELPFEITPNGKEWILREYTESDELVIKDLKNPSSLLKAFPLKPKIIKEDYPVFDGGGLANELEERILELEESGVIDDYGELLDNVYGHKLGGYPSFCQPGPDFGKGFEFVFQVASDEKVNLNIVDDGTFFFVKNHQTEEWKYYCDFY